MRVKFYENVQDLSGNAINNASVSVYLNTNKTPATVYVDGNPVNTIPQTHTNEKGYFEFEVDDDMYSSETLFDITINDSGNEINLVAIPIINLRNDKIVIKAAQVQMDNGKFNAKNMDEFVEEVGETNFWNGFDRNLPETMGQISWNTNTREFSISPVNGKSFFYFYAGGKKITKTETESVTIPDVSGTYYIYYDTDGNLNAIAHESMSRSAFLDGALVGLVYWNDEAKEGNMGDERHGIRMSGMTHMVKHFTTGALYSYGFDIVGLESGEKTYTHITNGKMWDEDISHDHILSTEHPFLWREGVGGWRFSVPSNEVAYKVTGNNYYSWNYYDSNNNYWMLKQGLSDSDFWIIFFVAFPSFDGAKVFKIIGQNAYPSRGAARSNIENEIRKITTDGLPTLEMIWLYAIIVKRNGKLQTLADGSLYLDFRFVKGTGGQPNPPSYANDISTDTSNFNKILTSNETDVQKALEKLDALNLTDTNTSATGGSANLPPNPVGFVTLNLNGTDVLIPYYNKV